MTTNDSTEAVEAILQIERHIMAAIKSKDATSLEPMLAEEFIYRTHFGAEADKRAQVRGDAPPWRKAR